MTYSWGGNNRMKGRKRWYDTHQNTRVQCTWCGGTAHTAAVEYGLCAKCLQVEERKNKDRTQRNDSSHQYIVVRSSDKMLLGGRFSKDEFDAGLRYGTWPLGAVFECQGRRLVVCGIGKAYRDPAEKLPEQWAITIASSE